jgi:hypothetical protein
MCKQNFGTKAQTKVAAHKDPFPILLTFADGRSTHVELTLCNSIVDIAEISSSASDTTTGDEKSNYFVVFIAIFIIQDDIIQIACRATMIDWERRKFEGQQRCALFAKLI